METIKIYYNGFRLGNSKELIKAHISMNGDRISIYARDYCHLPRGYGFGVKNDSDSMTDYFECDRASVAPDHPLYKYLKYAAAKSEYMDAKHTLKNKYYSTIPSHVEHANKAIADFEQIPDPGQPTKADVDSVQQYMYLLEKQRLERERNEREARAAARQIESMETEITIQLWTEHYPLVEGEAWVEVPFSERGGIEEGSKWSLKAAERIFRILDAREHEKHAGYDKTDFVIHWGDNTYHGRYDIGDGEGGLLAHIRNLGEWSRTHTEFGAEKETPDVTNDYLEIYKAIGPLAV